MNLLIAYSLLPTSLRRLYERKGIGGVGAATIAFAMTGLLIVNLWSLVWLFSALYPEPLRNSHIEWRAVVSIVLVAIFLAELFFVKLVARRIVRERAFADHMQAARPVIWLWYTAMSLLTFAFATIAVIVRGI
jgi:hypothetical protein